MNALKTDFQTEVLDSAIPVLVDFSAEWCGPCKAIGPAVEQLAEELKGQVKVVKIDVDEHTEIASKYGIMSIPALVVFKGGQEVDRIVGAVPKATIEALVKRHV